MTRSHSHTSTIAYLLCEGLPWDVVSNKDYGYTIRSRFKHVLPLKLEQLAWALADQQRKTHHD